MKYIQSLRFDFIEMLNFAERPFRATFIPGKIWDDLDAYKNDSIGLRNYFRKWKCKVTFKQPNKQNRDGRYIPVGGFYLPDQNSVELDIYTTNYDKFEFTNLSWNRLKFKMIQVMMHELIHCRQYMGKHEDFAASVVKFHKTGVSKIDENRHYHSGRDEIEAYAHCIYLDFKMYKPTISVIDLIRRSRHKRDSVTFAGIIKLFGRDDRNNHALPLLIRKILTWERKYKRFR
jgi:hypothetical protein